MENRHWKMLWRQGVSSWEDRAGNAASGTVRDHPQPPTLTLKPQTHREAV